MTGAVTGLMRDADQRAGGDASLLVAALSLLLVPVPALLTSVGANASHVTLAATERVLGNLAAASPFFAIMPFVLGCGIGTLLHLVVTAPERFARIRAEREARIGARSLVAISLIVGGTFAATGLVAAIALF